MSLKDTNKNNLTYAFLIAAMLCWGLSFVWYKQALEYFKPITLVLARLLISFPLLLIASILLKRLKKVDKKDIPTFLLLAFLEPFVYFLGESTGMQYVSSTVAAIIITTIPVFTATFSFFFLKERLAMNNYIGFGISFIGVILVIMADKENMHATFKGLVFMLLAVFAAVGYGLIVKRIAAKYNSLTIVSVQNFIGAIYFIPLYFIFEHKETINTNWTFNMLINMLYLAIFASTFAYLGFIQGLRKLGVSKATVFTNFIPVFTAIFAYFILKDSISGLKFSGIALVVGGLILSQTNKRLKKAKPEDNIVNELY
jgi:drug/metabolite transporter (DMT)-like permease